MRTIYIAFCAKSDGLSPYSHSLRSFGASAYLEDSDLPYATFSRRIRPIHGDDPAYLEKFWGPNWYSDNCSAAPPLHAFRDFSNWVSGLQSVYRVEWVAHSSAGDWVWLKYYFDRYGDPSVDIGYYCNCLSSMMRAYILLDRRINRRGLISKLCDTRVFSNCADRDATKHGLMFIRLLRMVRNFNQVPVPWDRIEDGSECEDAVLYASIDAELDGPGPFRNSMRSIGIVLHDGRGRKLADSFYVHISPRVGATVDNDCLIDFWEKNPEQWYLINTNTKVPHEAMSDLALWLERYSREYTIKWVAAPSNVDWMWLKTYYDAYGPGHKWDIGNYCHCMSSLLKVYTMTHVIPDRKAFYDRLAENESANHNALQDATRQAVMYKNLRRLFNIKKF